MIFHIILTLFCINLHVLHSHGKSFDDLTCFDSIHKVVQDWNPKVVGRGFIINPWLGEVKKSEEITYDIYRRLSSMPKEVQYDSHQCVNESAFGKNFPQMEANVAQEEKVSKRVKKRDIQKHGLNRLQRKVLVSYGTECNKWREEAPSSYLLQLSVSGHISSKLFYKYEEKFLKLLMENIIILVRQGGTTPTRYA